MTGSESQDWMARGRDTDDADADDDPDRDQSVREIQAKVGMRDKEAALVSVLQEHGECWIAALSGHTGIDMSEVAWIVDGNGSEGEWMFDVDGRRVSLNPEVAARL